MPHEQPPKIELDRSLIQAYAQTFIARYDLYPMQVSTGRYVCIKKSLDLALVSLHLQGSPTLGAYALDRQSQAKWVCLDADTDVVWQRLIEVAADLQRQGMPPYLEQSRRGGHLWLFTPHLPGADARRLGQFLAGYYGLGSIEVYPKQDRLVTGPGSFVRLPLGKHLKSGRRYYFIHPTGEPLAPSVREQIQRLSSPALVPVSFISHALATVPSGREALPTRPFLPYQEKVKVETVSERLKNAVSVKDFVTHYIELDERGHGFCPFHDDAHKSFGVNETGNYWHCWSGCGGGSIIDFWMKWREKNGEDGSFVPTLKELAQMLL